MEVLAKVLDANPDELANTLLETSLKILGKPLGKWLNDNLCSIYALT